jgi:hypothetical protein
VFDNRVQRKTRTVACGKLRNDELRDLYISPHTITAITEIWTRLTGNVACMGEKRNSYRFLVGKPKRKRPLVRRGEGAGQIGGSYRNNTEVRGLDQSHLGEGQMSASCKHGNDKFLD